MRIAKTRGIYVFNACLSNHTTEPVPSFKHFVLWEGTEELKLKPGEGEALLGSLCVCVGLFVEISVLYIVGFPCCFFDVP